VSVEERAARLENQLKHGMLDSTDAAIKINMCLEVRRNLSISACSSWHSSQQCHIPSHLQSQQVAESTGAALRQCLMLQTAYSIPSSWEWERLFRAYSTPNSEIRTLILETRHGRGSRTTSHTS
jgi:hypothetical protein